VVYCPVCKTEWEDDVTECPICGRDLEGDEEEGDTRWVMLGIIQDKLSADFAKETLKSYEIPAIIISRSGFFGNVGLPLNPFYSTRSPLFEISVLSVHVKEASGILDMTLGDKWERKET
jgi:hypothetical protein